MPPAAIVMAPGEQPEDAFARAGTLVQPAPPTGAERLPTGEPSAEPQPPAAGSRPLDGTPEAAALASSQDSAAAEEVAEEVPASDAPAFSVEAGQQAAIEPTGVPETPAGSVLAEGYDPLATGAYETAGSNEAYATAAGADSSGEPRAASDAEDDRAYTEPAAAGPALVAEQGETPVQESTSPWSDVPAYGDPGALAGAGAEDDLTPSPHQFWSGDSSLDLGRTAEADEGSSSGRLVEYEPPQTVDVRTTRRPRRRTGMLTQMLGVVGGGALGVAIGYYLLVLILGPRGDFLELRSKLPSWMLPGGRTPADDQSPDATGGRQRPRRPAGRSRRIEREAATPPLQVHKQPQGTARGQNLQREAALAGTSDVVHASYTAASHAAASHAGASHTGASHTGASHTGASQAGASQAGASHAGASHAAASHRAASDTAASDTGASDTGASDTGASHARVSHTGASHAEASHPEAFHPEAFHPEADARRGAPLIAFPLTSHTGASQAEADARLRARSDGDGLTQSAQQVPGNGILYTARDVQHRAAAVAAAIGCPRFARQAEPAASPASNEEYEPGGQTACAACAARAEAGLSLKAYAELCRLAEAVTLLRAPQDEAERAQLRAAVCDVLSCVTASPGRLPVLGRLAAQRMRSSQRTCGGIALAGTVRAIECSTERCALTIVLLGEPVTVTAVAPGSPATLVFPGDRVLILGYLPNDHDAAAGKAASGNGRMVWGGLCLPVAAVHGAASPKR